MKACLIRGVAALAFLASSAIALPALANPVGGEMSGVNRAPALGAGVHKILYRGGEQADFSFAGDGDTKMSVLVKDENGVEVIRFSSGSGDSGHVWWTPSRTSVYTIYVINHGNVYNEYRWRAY